MIVLRQVFELGSIPILSHNNRRRLQNRKYKRGLMFHFCLSLSPTFLGLLFSDTVEFALCCRVFYKYLTILLQEHIVETLMDLYISSPLQTI